MQIPRTRREFSPVENRVGQNLSTFPSLFLDFMIDALPGWIGNLCCLTLLTSREPETPRTPSHSLEVHFPHHSISCTIQCLSRGSNCIQAERKEGPYQACAFISDNEKRRQLVTELQPYREVRRWPRIMLTFCP